MYVLSSDTIKLALRAQLRWTLDQDPILFQNTNFHTDLWQTMPYLAQTLEREDSACSWNSYNENTNNNNSDNKHDEITDNSRNFQNEQQYTILTVKLRPTEKIERPTFLMMKVTSGSGTEEAKSPGGHKAAMPSNSSSEERLRENIANSELCDTPLSEKTFTNSQPGENREDRPRPVNDRARKATEEKACYHHPAKHIYECQKSHNEDGRTAGPYCTAVKLLEDSRRGAS